MDSQPWARARHPPCHPQPLRQDGRLKLGAHEAAGAVHRGQGTPLDAIRRTLKDLHPKQVDMKAPSTIRASSGTEICWMICMYTMVSIHTIHIYIYICIYIYVYKYIYI